MGAAESTVTTQAVVAVLRQAGHRAAKIRGISVTLAGFKVNKLTEDTVRVYYFGVSSRDNSRLAGYQAALEQAGYTVESHDVYLNVTRKDA